MGKGGGASNQRMIELEKREAFIQRANSYRGMDMWFGGRTFSEGITFLNLVSQEFYNPRKPYRMMDKTPKSSLIVYS